MEVRHCPNRHCKDGKVIDYGEPHDPVIDCPECGGTGHVWTLSPFYSVTAEEWMWRKEKDKESYQLININPMVGLHDKETCDGYIAGTCEDDPCPDCELAYATQENE